MKIHIEVVTGFLGAGKTTFINSLLQESLVDGEKVLVIELEQGNKKINIFSNLVKVQSLNEVSELENGMMSSINKFKPNRIIIEYNGTANIKELLDILNEKKYAHCSKITTIYFIADGKCLKQYIENIGSFIIPFIQYANMIVVNNIDNCYKGTFEESIKMVREINPKAYMLKVKNKYILNSVLRESKVLDNGYIKKIKIKMENSRLRYL